MLGSRLYENAGGGRVQKNLPQKREVNRKAHSQGEPVAMEGSHRLSRLLLNAQEEERGRIARELHDSIGQDVALLVINLHNAVQQSQSVEELGGRVLRLATAAERIGMSVSRISREIHSSELDLLGLHVAVSRICREFSVNYGIGTQVSCGKIPAGVAKGVALGIYRVLQEALHNVAKHSKATEVAVELLHEGDEIVLRVSDNGLGFRVDRKFTSGLGLLSMRERVHGLGGKVAIQSKPGGGTRIRVRVPLANRERVPGERKVIEAGEKE